MMAFSNFRVEIFKITNLCVTGLHLVQVALDGAAFQRSGNNVDTIGLKLLEEPGRHD